ncbi:hypothetical protein SB782_34805, partial [Brevibacillus sp. SIMBA_076]
EQGIPARAIGLPKFAGSGFTAAVLRGAEFVGVQSLEGRFAVAADVVAAGPGLTYLYVAELDQLAHARGWESADWTAALETLDAQVASL